MSAGSASVRSSIASNRSTLVAAGVGACHIPMLSQYLRQLTGFEHYLFWPFAIAAIGCFLWKRINWQRFQLSLPGWLLLAVDSALLLGSGLLNSPWLCAAGVFCLLSAVAVSASDKETGRLPFEFPMLFATLLRPPAELDIALIQKMQLWTTSVSGAILDRLGVLHVRSGNLIELADKELFVEEACSGIQSLFTLLFLAAFIAASKRRPISHTIGLLIAAPICAAPMNVVRVTAIALGWNKFQVDLSSGIGHDVLGYVLLFAATGFLWSGDQFLHFLGRKVDDGWSINRDRPYRNPYTSVLNLFWKQLPSARFARVGVSRVAMICSLVAAVSLGGLQCKTLLGSRSRSIAGRTDLIESLAMPDKIGPLTLRGTETEERARASSFGAFSQRWIYADETTTYFVSCDFPFASWHKLETCYEGIGWQVVEGAVVGDDWPATTFSLSKATGELAFLAYSFIDGSGESVRPPKGEAGAAIMDRLRKTGLTGGQSETYQSQVVVFTTLPLTDRQRDRAIQLHSAARQILKDHFTSRDSKGAK